jgi:hypothetical protein
MNVPFCIGRCGVCPYYESCQLTCILQKRNNHSSIKSLSQLPLDINSDIYYYHGVGSVSRKS